MRRFVPSLFFLAACAAFAADSSYNGRWDITVTNEPRRRAWWLQVEGAGTPALKGKFVGFPGGNMNDIEKIRIENGELKFRSEEPARANDKGGMRQQYSARLAGDKLEGVMQQGTTRRTFTGVRAP